jgi:hypothetical protein
MSAPVEQEHVEVILEPADCVGDGGGNAVEFVRGRGEAAAAVYGIEYRQRIERNAHIQII